MASHTGCAWLGLTGLTAGISTLHGVMTPIVTSIGSPAICFVSKLPERHAVEARVAERFDAHVDNFRARRLVDRRIGDG